MSKEELQNLVDKIESEGGLHMYLCVYGGNLERTPFYQMGLDVAQKYGQLEYLFRRHCKACGVEIY